MTITEVGLKFKILPRYTLNGYIHDEKISSENFILNLIIHYNEKYYTMQETKSICGPKLARSIEDIYRITKSYYPQITLTIIMTHLTKWVLEKRINVLFCKEIKKRVFNIKFTQFNSFGEEGSNKYNAYNGTAVGADEHGITGDMYLNLLN